MHNTEGGEREREEEEGCILTVLNPTMPNQGVGSAALYLERLAMALCVFLAFVVVSNLQPPSACVCITVLTLYHHWAFFSLPLCMALHLTFSMGDDWIESRPHPVETSSLPYIHKDPIAK